MGATLVALILRLSAAVIYLSVFLSPPPSLPLGWGWGVGQGKA